MKAEEKWGVPFKKEQAWQEQCRIVRRWFSITTSVLILPLVILMAAMAITKNELVGLVAALFGGAALAVAIINLTTSFWLPPPRL